MWNRLKAILADFIQQADLVLLGLCCAATLYGMALIASATRYLGTGGILRYVGVQGAAMVLGICAYIFMSMLDLERLMPTIRLNSSLCCLKKASTVSCRRLAPKYISLTIIGVTNDCS